MCAIDSSDLSRHSSPLRHARRQQCPGIRVREAIPSIRKGGTESCLERQQGEVVITLRFCLSPAGLFRILYISRWISSRDLYLYMSHVVLY